MPTIRPRGRTYRADTEAGTGRRQRGRPRIRHQRGSRRRRLVGRRGCRPCVPRFHECGACSNRNFGMIPRPANSESRSRVVARLRPALRGKRACVNSGASSLPANHRAEAEVRRTRAWLLVRRRGSTQPSTAALGARDPEQHSRASTDRLGQMAEVSWMQQRWEAYRRSVAGVFAASADPLGVQAVDLARRVR